MSRNGKRYDEQFKKEIVRLIQEEKRSVAGIVKDFGVSEQTVRNWLKTSQNAQDPERSRIVELEAQIKVQDKKIADQEMTIEILKKLPPSSSKATGNNIQNNQERKRFRLSG